MTIAFISSLNYTPIVKNYPRHCHMKAHNPANCFNFDQNTFAEVLQQCGIRSKAPSPTKLVYFFWNLLFTKTTKTTLLQKQPKKTKVKARVDHYSILYTELIICLGPERSKYFGFFFLQKKETVSTCHFPIHYSFQTNYFSIFSNWQPDTLSIDIFRPQFILWTYSNVER